MATKTSSEKKKMKNLQWGIIAGLICVCIIMAFVSVFLYNRAIRVGAEAVRDSYSSAYKTEKDSTYKAIYDKFKSIAEEKYHVSNRVTISIQEVKETAKLEVLKVSDVEFIIEGKQDNDNNITTWLEVPGDAAFIVDLAAGEYIVDDERQYVLIRLPYPELTNVSIDYANVKKLLFQNDMFNDSYSAGEDTAKKLLDKADLLIKKEFISNETFYLNAQDSARSTIINLVKQLNPKVTDIDVEVEFY